MKLGVLGIQGDIQEHIKAIKNLGHEAIWVKKTADLASVSGLIMPGGESTTMIKLLKRFDMWASLNEAIDSGLHVYATCAGVVLLARDIKNHPDQDTLNILDVTVARNGYGRQIASFETDLKIDSLGEIPFRAIFIRAPIIENIDPEIKILSSYRDQPVLVEKDNVLASTFHPELTDDIRIHEYFVNRIK